MPTIPQYQGGSVVDALSAPQQSGLSGWMFQGQDLAGMASQALDNAANFFEDQQKIKDADAVNRAEIEFATSEQDFRAQLQERAGVNAYGVTKDTEKWVQDKYKATMSVLENDRQRKAFEARFAERALRLRGDAMNHESRQTKEAYAESRTAQVNLAISDAAADPTKVAESKLRIDTVLRDVAGIRGWTDEQYQSERMKFTSALHEQVIQTLNRQNPASAKAYFEENKGEIDGTKHNTIMKVYEASDRLTRVQDFADKVSGMTIEQQMAEARKTFSGEDEKDAILEIKTRYNDKQALIKEDNDKKFNDAWTIAIDQGRGIKGIDPQVWATMDPKDKVSIQRELEHRSDRAYTLSQRNAGERSTKTDNNVWGGLYQLSVNNPQEFVGLDLRRYMPWLSSSDFQELTKRQATVKDGLSKPEKIKRMSTIDNQIMETANAAGLFATSKTKDFRAEFIKKANNAILTEARAKGKDADQLTDEETQKVLDRMLIKGEVDGSGWISDDKKFAFQLKPEEQANFIPEDPAAYYANITLADVPADFADEVRAEARKRNKTPTPQMIVDKYKQYKLKDK